FRILILNLRICINYDASLNPYVATRRTNYIKSSNTLILGNKKPAEAGFPQISKEDYCFA
ncbi:MAG: hypothetical protein KAZ72_01585, partial [Acinetobacter sp.]|nr:hypothetical protein [Acinetobacter sp.]